MSLRGLVSFGAPSDATVGVSVVPKKLGKQMLIFDARRVNQHFRRPWHCVLPTPASWAGLQLPADLAYHMAQTDVNRILARVSATSGSCRRLFLGASFLSNDCPKVLASMKAAKATLGAAGPQCSEVEADISRQDFTGLQLDYESGILSLEDSRIWRLRHGVEFAASQKQLTGDQVAKLIGHITWSCLLRRPDLSLINTGYRFARTFGPRRGRLWPAVAQESSGWRHCFHS